MFLILRKSIIFQVGYFFEEEHLLSSMPFVLILSCNFFDGKTYFVL